MSDVTTELANEASDKAMEIARLKAENASLKNEVELLKAIWTQVRLEGQNFKTENSKLREDLEFERSENGWAREFLNRMGQKCGTKDCSSLVAYVTKLEAENAKLREELEAVGTAAYLYGRTDLEAENAKLRELVRDVYTLHWNGLDCTECPWFDECDTTGGCPWLSIFADHMRDLGVEVDA